MAGVYFDTSVFTSIFKPEPERAKQVRTLVRELKKNNTRIHTSIVSVQECSVLTFKRGQLLRDYHEKIGKLAEIHTIDKNMAVNAAKLESEIIQHIPSKEQDKPRRKWDCFHIATARCLECNTLYSWDSGMVSRKTQLGITDIEITYPTPKSPELNFGSRRPKAKKTAVGAGPGLFDNEEKQK